jgi:hypothetical protein
VGFKEGQQGSPENGGGDGGVLTKAERAAQVHNKAERAARLHFAIFNFNSKFVQPSAQRESRNTFGVL